MKKRANALQAALTGAAVAEAPPAKSKATPKKRNAAGQGRAVQQEKPKIRRAEESKPSRENTVLVGGHFPPHVLRQLRMIAAEEGTTNQALLGEALDLLFTRKGKDKIEDLAAG